MALLFSPNNLEDDAGQHGARYASLRKPDPSRIVVRMKKPKPGAEISASQSGRMGVPRFNSHTDFLFTNETSGGISLAQARPELQIRNHPVTQLNRHQHGVWV